jgi:hypothetical protein
MSKLDGREDVMKSERWWVRSRGREWGSEPIISIYLVNISRVGNS